MMVGAVRTGSVLNIGVKTKSVQFSYYYVIFPLVILLFRSIIN